MKKSELEQRVKALEEEVERLRNQPQKPVVIPEPCPVPPPIYPRPWPPYYPWDRRRPWWPRRKRNGRN